MRKHNFNVRLVLGSLEKLNGQFKTQGGRGIGKYALILNPESHYDSQDYVDISMDSQTSEIYLNVQSDRLEKVDGRVVGVVQYATVSFSLGSGNELPSGKYVHIDGDDQCEAIFNEGVGRSGLSAEGKDPFVLRQFVEDILDHKILPVGEGEEKSLNIDEMKGLLEAIERRVMLAEEKAKSTDKWREDAERYLVENINMSQSLRGILTSTGDWHRDLKRSGNPFCLRWKQIKSTENIYNDISKIL